MRIGIDRLGDAEVEQLQRNASDALGGSSVRKMLSGLMSRWMKTGAMRGRERGANLSNE